MQGLNEVAQNKLADSERKDHVELSTHLHNFMPRFLSLVQDESCSTGLDG